ncbi:MAG TPA: hypothetical protein VFI12_11035, partial [Thermomicrobiales bacterium]|nr:hypothetical protein [Thermomicrobiales bacterium]
MALFRHVPHALTLSPALIVALMALVLSVAGNAAAALIIMSNTQVGAGTIAGHHPPSGDHANLIAGSVNGIDIDNDSITGADVNEETLRGSAHKLYFFDSESTDPARTLAIVGPWTVKAECIHQDVPNSQVLELLVNGPGEAQV